MLPPQLPHNEEYLFMADDLHLKIFIDCFASEINGFMFKFSYVFI